VTRARLVARNTSRGAVLGERIEDGSSFWSRFMGLMGRASLPAGCGLWMPGENSIHMLFMRFAIDVVFVARPPEDNGGPRRVVAARRAVRPWRGIVWPVLGAYGVLELPAGTIEATGTQIGDEIVLEGAG
jgi:uncharacterized membrane protein (UPF0127 family)